MVDIGAFEAEPGPPPVPTGFLVNSNLDTVDTTPGDGVCADAAGNCTLRAAIQETNALPGADTITLPADTYTLSIPGIDEDAAESGDLDITDDLTINGGGADTAIIDGGALDRVFDIAPGSATDISGVTVRNGSSSGGGGIGNEGTLTLNNSTLSGNTGRGISSTGTVTINNSTASGNTGRGIANAGTMTIDNSTVSGNSGGGIFNSGSGVGTMTLVNSTVSGNTKATGNGGGIFNSGTMTVTNSTVSGNETAHIEAQGGGIANSGTLTLTNSTVSGNLALTPFGGGGIFSSGGTVNVKNTIIAGNSDLLGEGPDCVGTLTSQGHNLVQAPFGCTITGDPTGNITGEDPLLGPLQDNGGPTFTHALLEESRAIDAGDDAVLAEPFLLEFDQRGPGFPRQLDGKGDGTPVVDIGAFELEAEPAADTPQTSPLTVNKTEDTDDGLCGTLDCSLREAIASGSGATINIPMGVYTLTLGSELSINADMSLVGAGAATTIIQASVAPPGEATHRVLNISAGVVETSGVTVRHGNVDGDGGGILINGGALTLGDSTVSDNSSGAGGGIYNAGGTLSLTDSAVSGNSVEAGSGGGIYNFGGTLTLTNSTLSGNTRIPPAAAS